MLHQLAGVALVTLVFAAAAGPAAAATDPVAADLGRHRIVLVSAPDGSDGELAHQRAVFAAMGEGARERDLRLIEAVGRSPEADGLRRAYNLDPAVFTAVLIGKDGGAKLRSAQALGPDRLFPTIDAMPMRQDEMRRRR